MFIKSIESFRIVCISDTNQLHNSILLRSQWVMWWFIPVTLQVQENLLKNSQKIIIAGNHDITMQTEYNKNIGVDSMVGPYTNPFDRCFQQISTTLISTFHLIKNPLW